MIFSKSINYTQNNVPCCFIPHKRMRHVQEEKRNDLDWMAPFQRDDSAWCNEEETTKLAFSH